MVVAVELKAFERDELPLVEPWFEDVETRRWLGGPQWPRQMLDLAERPLSEFRGAVETGRYRWLAWNGGGAVGYCDAGTFDRWTTWDGERVIGTVPVTSASIAFVVAPTQRRRGYGAAILEALKQATELTDVELLAAGVEPANDASVACLQRAGFDALDPRPDFEGFLYYAWRR